MHEYEKRLEKAIALGIIDKGSVAHATIAHDDDCNIYNGYECDCNPDITIHTTDGPVSVQRDGTLRGKNN
jgi:hypothetical protein